MSNKYVYIYTYTFFIRLDFVFSDLKLDVK